MPRPVSLALLLVFAGASAAADKEIAFKVYGPYFESNKSGLTGDASYLVIRDQKGFDMIFRGVPPLLKGKKPDLVPKDHFDKHLVIAVVKRGNQPYKYEVTKVTQSDGVLRIAYKATAQGKAGTAKFASPVIVGVPKGAYKSVELVENGKAVKSMRMGELKRAKSGDGAVE